MNKSDLKLYIDETFGTYILQEGDNTSTELSYAKWSENGRFALDIRKFIFNSGGEKRASKGVRLNDDGGNELVNILTEKGYGNTRTILNNISKREDFKIALELYENGTLSQPIEQPDVSEYYDANELLKNAIS